MVVKYSTVRKPRDFRFTVWRMPFSASAAPLVTRVRRQATTPSQWPRRIQAVLFISGIRARAPNHTTT